MKPVTPLPAATLMILKNHQEGMQVFMQQRSYDASFVGGAFVFPGGKVDALDYDFPERLISYPDKLRAGILLEKPQARVFAIAAIRESFEEAGFLLAYDEGGELLAINTKEKEAYWLKQRMALNAGEITFTDICLQNSLKLAFDKLAFFGHWITPITSSQRFDTLFFACEVPPYQEGDHDDFETIHSVWWNAEQALHEYQQQKIKLITPTLKSLEHLHQFSTVEDFITHHAKGLSILGRE